MKININTITTSYLQEKDSENDLNLFDDYINKWFEIKPIIYDKRYKYIYFQNRDQWNYSSDWMIINIEIEENLTYVYWDSIDDDIMFYFSYKGIFDIKILQNKLKNIQNMTKDQIKNLFISLGFDGDDEYGNDIKESKIYESSETMKTIKDVKEWIESLYDNYEIQFYPQTDFSDYMENSKPKFSSVQAEVLNKQKEEAFQICLKYDEDIEKIALNIFQEYMGSLESDILENKDLEERTIMNDLRYQLYTFIINYKNKEFLIQSFIPEDFEKNIQDFNYLDYKKIITELISNEQLFTLKKLCMKCGFEKINLKQTKNMKESKILSFNQFLLESNSNKYTIHDFQNAANDFLNTDTHDEDSWSRNEGTQSFDVEGEPSKTILDDYFRLSDLITLRGGNGNNYDPVELAFERYTKGFKAYSEEDEIFDVEFQSRFETRNRNKIDYKAGGRREPKV